MKQIKNSMLYLIPILLIILIPFKASARITGTPIGAIEHIMIHGEREYNRPLYQGGSSGQYTPWSGVGEGNIIFSVLTTNVDQGQESVDQIQAIYINTTNGGNYVCDIGNQISYIDNGTQRVLYTANCPVTLEQGEAWRYIRIQRGDSYGKLKIVFSTHATFVSKDNMSVNVNQQQVVQAISDSQTATINAITSASNQAHSDATTTNNKLTDMIQHSDANWNAMMETDISNNAKQQPSQIEYDDVQDQEDVIYDSLDDIDVDTLVDMNIDINTSNWIWNTITSILQANQRVMAMVISVLSLGLCKFVLGR